MYAQHILQNWKLMCPVYSSSNGRDRKGIKSHPDRLLSSPTCSLWNFLSPWCVPVRVRLCYVYQTVCVSACVHGFPCGCESTCVHVCIVCFNASATCGNLKLWGWNRLPCWGLFSVVPSFSAFFPFCV